MELESVVTELNVQEVLDATITAAIRLKQAEADYRAALNKLGEVISKVGSGTTIGVLVKLTPEVVAQ